MAPRVTHIACLLIAQAFLLVLPAAALDTVAADRSTSKADSTALAAAAVPLEAAAAPIIDIDNDEQNEQQQQVQFRELPADETGMKATVGAQFPVVVISQVSSKTAKVGDPVQGRLKYDLKIGSRLVAPKGAEVRGHITYALPARTPLRCTLSTHRWTMTSGCVGLHFDEIISASGDHVPLVAEPARAPVAVNNKAQGRLLGVNHKGEVAAPYSLQVKYQAIRLGLNAAMTPAGVFSFGAAPVALGLLGAANPSFAFGKPIGTNVRHRRLKGFFWGALSGVPGSWLIEGTTVKGEEVKIEPGDEFIAELRQDFTGMPSADAEMSGADKNVHGEVIKRKKKK